MLPFIRCTVLSFICEPISGRRNWHLASCLHQETARCSERQLFFLSLGGHDRVALSATLPYSALSLSESDSGPKTDEILLLLKGRPLPEPKVERCPRTPPFPREKPRLGGVECFSSVAAGTGTGGAFVLGSPCSGGNDGGRGGHGRKLSQGMCASCRLYFTLDADLSCFMPLTSFGGRGGRASLSGGSGGAVSGLSGGKGGCASEPTPIALETDTDLTTGGQMELSSRFMRIPIDRTHITNNPHAYCEVSLASSFSSCLLDFFSRSFLP